jgi:Domain of unknown function (DUF4394)
MRRKLLIPSILAGLSALAVGAVPAQARLFKDSGDCASSSRFERDLDIVGLTADGKLVCFEDDDPRDADRMGSVTGLQMDAKLVGIDYRPATGDLYGLGDRGGVYVVDASNAKASLRSRLNVALEGTQFGVDFNPTVDRLRIVSDTGQNLRANVDTGITLEDGDLNYLGPPVVNPALGVTAVAYTNNDADPNTATTLFDIDTSLDQVTVQAPPNAGTLNPTGKLLVDARSPVGFDIYSTISSSGMTVDNDAYASLATPSGRGFYSVDPVTGRATFKGQFRFRVVDIAIPLDQR